MSLSLFFGLCLNIHVTCCFLVVMMCLFFFCQILPGLREIQEPSPWQHLPNIPEFLYVSNTVHGQTPVDRLNLIVSIFCPHSNPSSATLQNPRNTMQEEQTAWIWELLHSSQHGKIQKTESFWGNSIRLHKIGSTFRKCMGNPSASPKSSGSDSSLKPSVWNIDSIDRWNIGKSYQHLPFGMPNEP